MRTYFHMEGYMYEYIKGKYIDINVFNGGTEEFKLFLQNNAYRAGADGDYNA